MSDKTKIWLALAISAAALIIALYHHHTQSGTVKVG